MLGVLLSPGWKGCTQIGVFVFGYDVPDAGHLLLIEHVPFLHQISNVQTQHEMELLHRAIRQQDVVGSVSQAETQLAEWYYSCSSSIFLLGSIECNVCRLMAFRISINFP